MCMHVCCAYACACEFMRAYVYPHIHTLATIVKKISWPDLPLLEALPGEVPAAVRLEVGDGVREDEVPLLLQAADGARAEEDLEETEDMKRFLSENMSR